MKKNFGLFTHQERLRSVYIADLESVFLSLNFLLVAFGIVSHRGHYLNVLFLIPVICFKGVTVLQVDWSTTDPHFKTLFLGQRTAIFVIEVESLACFSE